MREREMRNMQDFTEEELNKLPKWAREKIKIITSENGQLQKELNALNCLEQTEISYSTGISQRKSYLPRHSTITFEYDKKRVDVLLVERNKRLTLEISTWNTLVVYPKACNAIAVDVVWDNRTANNVGQDL